MSFNNTNSDILIVSSLSLSLDILPINHHAHHSRQRLARLLLSRLIFSSTLLIPSRLDCNHQTISNYTPIHPPTQSILPSFVACTKALAVSYSPQYLLVILSTQPPSLYHTLISPSRSILYHIRRHQIHTQPHLPPNPHNSLDRFLGRRAGIMLHPHTSRSPQAECSGGFSSSALAHFKQNLRRQCHHTCVEKVQ